MRTPPHHSESTCLQVLAAVRKQCTGAILESDEGPKLVMDFDRLGNGAHPAIVWEEGPYEWTYLFPYGGIEEEFGTRVPDVSKMLPVGVFCEPDTAWALSICNDI